MQTEKISTPIEFYHQQESQPWLKRRNPLMGVQYSESINNFPNGVFLECFPEKDKKLLFSNVQRDQENTTNVVDTQTQQYNKLLARKEYQKSIDDQNYQKKLELIKEQVKNEKTAKRQKMIHNQNFVKMQIAQNKKVQNTVRLKAREPGQLCAITGNKDYDENEMRKSKLFQEKNKKFT